MTPRTRRTLKGLKDAAVGAAMMGASGVIGFVLGWLMGRA